MKRCTVLLLALTACGGAPFRLDTAPAEDAGADVLELDAGVAGNALGTHVAEGAPSDAIALGDAGPGPSEAGAEAGDERRPDPSPEAAPDAPTFSPEAGPDSPVDAGHPGAVCCNLGTSCHSLAAACTIASNGTPTCYCGSARACEAADLGAYCYLINGCSGTVAWCPTGAE
jgi:hypothetical protein